MQVGFGSSYLGNLSFTNPAWAVTRVPFFTCFLKTRERKRVNLSNHGWNQFPNSWFQIRNRLATIINSIDGWNNNFRCLTLVKIRFSSRLRFYHSLFQKMYFWLLYTSQLFESFYSMLKQNYLFSSI